MTDKLGFRKLSVAITPDDLKKKTEGDNSFGLYEVSHLQNYVATANRKKLNKISV